MVTIVEFSDFECPFCRQAASYLTDLKAQYGDKLRLVFEVVARIQADIEEGRTLGVAATPTLFVNGREALNREEGIRTIVDHILSSP